MKKLFTLLTMLALTITGVQAQNHHVPYTGMKFLDASTLKSNVAAATGDYLVALQIHCALGTFYINNQGKAQTSFSSTGETTWIVKKTEDNKYLLQTYGGNYIKSLGNDNNTAATFTPNSNEALKFNPEQSTSTDLNMESGYVANQAIWWNVEGENRRINTNGINGNDKTIFKNDGTGCWTCLFTYEVTFKYQVTFSCKVGETLIYTESTFANTGEVLKVPDLPGYTAPSPSEYTVGSEDANHEIIYTPSLYPVNFTRGQTFTRSDRHINSVTFDIAGEEQTVNGLYNNTSTKCYQDLTDSKTVTLPVKTSVQPKFNVAGGWQHGFVYIDLNNDGDFIDDGELVSIKNERNPNLSTDMPSFKTPSTPGSYRMRIKTDWESTDPGGNTGISPHLITSPNHIIANGGMIVDVNLVITPAAGFYRVKNVATNGYLYATAASDYTSTDRYVYANGSNSGAETIIQLVDYDGHLYMLNQGHEFGWVAQRSTSVRSGEVGYVIANNFDKYVNWLPGTAAGQIAFAICLGNGTGDHASYLTQGIYAVDTNDNAVIRGTEGYTANTAQWVFEPATGFDVAMNGPVDGNHYATLCVPFDVTIGNDATAYTLAKSESGNYLVPTEVEGNQVPAGTPVLLKGTKATAKATINTGSAFNDGSPLPCALTGTYLPKTITGTTDYVFGRKDEKVGFYHWNSDNLGANRAYLAAESVAAGARGFALNFDDEATGIVTPSVDTERETTIYNLSGQRLNKVQKGINIVNGRKVLF